MTAIRHASRALHTSALTVSSVFPKTTTAEYAGAAFPDQTETRWPDLHGLPEIIVTGRANSGKSSLLNAVTGRTGLFHTSSKAGRTRQLNFFRVGPQEGKLVLVDAPGYGRRGRASWGELFEEYITTRTQLKRVYVTFNGKHRLNEYDEGMLKHLSEQMFAGTDGGKQRFTVQAVVTKGDELPSKDFLNELRQQIWDYAPLCLPPIVTSSRMVPPFGIDALRRNIVEACQG
ncbi:P-loop containing nucleoside triphosphate hydrolase protein [Cylindrobasidium torrendii FP15055 ss-10]|uniref:p-loop containing nucleoside triphosphate hydrolase protein n=1 Tax=Cylindrobasidium torrendii FP15055 ss-10 TaxID=1314674 RepID=A0A0D7ASH4_9AGAR|nr:P-loop containing nucleoside triphosphate hydrolase protein [Cylindrobasidium torrendii FP15055 ss-10]